MNWLKRLFVSRPVNEVKLAASTSAKTPMQSASGGDQQSALEEINHYVQRDVAAGFRSREEIIESTAEVLADDFEAAAIKPLIIECTDFFFAEHQREEANWPGERLRPARSSVRGIGGARSCVPAGLQLLRHLCCG